MICFQDGDVDTPSDGCINHTLLSYLPLHWFKGLAAPGFERRVLMDTASGGGRPGQSLARRRYPCSSRLPRPGSAPGTGEEAPAGIDLQCTNGIHGPGSPKLHQELWPGPWRDPGLPPVEPVKAARLRATLWGQVLSQEPGRAADFTAPGPLLLGSSHQLLAQEVYPLTREFPAWNGHRTVPGYTGHLLGKGPGPNQNQQGRENPGGGSSCWVLHSEPVMGGPTPSS